MITLTEVLQKKYNEVAKFHICRKPFDGLESNKNVRDHYYCRSLYWSAAQNCNFKCKIPNYILIGCLNLSGYILTGKLDAKLKTKDIGVTEKTNERYISFNVKINVELVRVTNKDHKEIRKNIQLRFIDSCKFIPSSLDKMTSNLNDDHIKNFRVFHIGDEIFKLMRSKGYYRVSTWIVERNLKGQSYCQRTHFTASCT